MMETIAESIKNMSRWSLPFSVIAADGSERWLLGDSVPECEPDGSIIWHGYI